jgi:uncharacterized protein (UPF0332 family)
MTFTWGEYYELADELIHSKKLNLKESRSRSAVSRAYYAAFHTALQFAIDYYPDFVPSNNHAHKVVIEWFESNEPKVGVELNQLLIFRKQCDYDDAVDKLDHISQKSIMLSKKIIEAINRQKISYQFPRK